MKTAIIPILLWDSNIPFRSGNTTCTGGCTGCTGDSNIPFRSGNTTELFSLSLSLSDSNIPFRSGNYKRRLEKIIRPSGFKYSFQVWKPGRGAGLDGARSGIQIFLSGLETLLSTIAALSDSSDSNIPFRSGNSALRRGCRALGCGFKYSFQVWKPVTSFGMSRPAMMIQIFLSGLETGKPGIVTIGEYPIQIFLSGLEMTPGCGRCRTGAKDSNIPFRSGNAGIALLPCIIYIDSNIPFRSGNFVMLPGGQTC